MNFERTLMQLRLENLAGRLVENPRLQQSKEQLEKMAVREEDLERVFRKIRPNPDTKCWEWQAARNDFGYGKGSINKTIMRIHRFMFLAFGGVITEEKPFVCHTCDNPRCCNPDHLWAGSSKDNCIDARDKGRMIQQRYPERLARGKRNGRNTHPERYQIAQDHYATKLSNEDVKSIRSRYEVGGISSLKLAAEFEVSKPTILRIIHRKTWKSIP